MKNQEITNLCKTISSIEVPNDIISISLDHYGNEIHMNKKDFLNIFKEEDCIREPYSYREKLSINIYGVTVFCLVECKHCGECKYRD